jgi:rubrerythrin
MSKFLEDIDRSGDVRTIAEDAGAFDLDGTRRDLLKRAGIAGGAVIGGSAALGLLSPFEAYAAGKLVPYSTKRKSLANDVKIGNYALTLEYLEAQFYAEAVASGKVTDADIAKFATTVAKHEQDHVDALKKILGKAAVRKPSADFSAYLVDQATILKAAILVEPVGTAAYAGAAPHIKTPSIVKAGLSIHSVEANHAAWAAALGNLKGIDTTTSPAPNSFNPAYGYKKTLKIVGSLNVLKG